jgi:acetyl-CoA carboxylase beta subunit
MIFETFFCTECKTICFHKEIKPDLWECEKCHHKEIRLRNLSKVNKNDFEITEYLYKENDKLYINSKVGLKIIYIEDLNELIRGDKIRVPIFKEKSGIKLL